MDQRPATGLKPPNEYMLVPGGVLSLFDHVANLTATVTNTKSSIAAKVVQLYFRRPNEHSKAKNLHGFRKTPGLKPSKSADVHRPLRRKDLSISSVGKQ